MRLLAIVFTLLVAAPASGADLLITTDPDVNMCNINLPPFQPTRLYVIGGLAPEACEGIGGAEFRIDGLPASVFVFPVADSRISGDPGNPFDGGARVVYSACVTASAAEAAVQVYRVDLFPVAAVSGELHLRGHSAPNDPQFDCPLIRLCDAPAFSAICVRPLDVHINGFPCNCQGCGLQPCTVAVAPTTWSQVKQLFGTH